MHRASDNTNAYSIDVYGNGAGATDAGYFRIINAKNPSALTPLVIDNNGNVGIGVGSSHPEHRFQIRQSDPSLNAYSLVESNRYAISSLRSYSNTGGNALQMIRARGSFSAPTAVQSGDWLGYWESVGYDTTSTTQVTSRILSVVNGAVSAGVLPTDMIFFTSPTDSAGLSERMRISSNGNVGIGTASPTNKLTVNGGITSTKWNVTQILNNQVGPLPITSTSFTTNGGTLLIAASGSGYNGGQIGMSIAVDGVIRGYAKTYSNEGASHKAFVPVQLVVTGITAGSHTITLAAWNSTASDGNDFYNITVTELPW
jgi:hypothetical protein